ncbi:DUF5107 domain-containing protein [Arenibacter sp. 6A1]|nr:DUF5107 domain-containing protein [Arenibacter sp. 6A1]NKI28439.1 DUF5107 domain-containing protein [Arenibacter sp. 6A1]
MTCWLGTKNRIPILASSDLKGYNSTYTCCPKIGEYYIIGHTPNSATPVDYIVKNNEDGSVSCVTSALDLLTRTRWVIETKLEKDKYWP